MMNCDFMKFFKLHLLVFVLLFNSISVDANEVSFIESLLSETTKSVVKDKEIELITEKLVASLVKGIENSLKNMDPVTLKNLTRPIAEGLMSGMQGGLGGFFQHSGKIFNSELYSGFSGVHGSIINLLKDGYSVTASGFWQIGVPIVVMAGVYFLLQYGLKVGSKIISELILKKIKTPDLALESASGYWGHLFKKKMGYLVIPPLSELSFPKKTEKQLNRYRTSIKNSIKVKKGIPRLLLVGPPGTGKTEWAERFAKNEDFNYIFISGSSLSQYPDGEGITKLTELIKWAQVPGWIDGRKVLIFIDEIDALLPKRDEKITVKERQILAQFLTLTGELSLYYTIIGATNRPDNLDEAIERRFIKKIELPLPDEKARGMMLDLYLKKFVYSDKNITIENNFLEEDQYKKEMIRITKGFSGADIKNLCSLAGDAAYEVENIRLSKKHFSEVINEIKEKRGLNRNYLNYEKINCEEESDDEVWYDAVSSFDGMNS